MKCEHTKGPWYVGAMNDALFIIDRPPAHFTDNGVREGGDTNIIASIKILDHRGVDDANARLIAAAPELLAALKRIMDGFDAGVWVRSTKDDADPRWAIKIIGHVQALGAAVAAIAKATEAQ